MPDKPLIRAYDEHRNLRGTLGVKSPDVPGGAFSFRVERAAGVPNPVTRFSRVEILPSSGTGMPLLAFDVWPPIDAVSGPETQLNLLQAAPETAELMCLIPCVLAPQGIHHLLFGLRLKLNPADGTVSVSHFRTVLKTPDLLPPVDFGAPLMPPKPLDGLDWFPEQHHAVFGAPDLRRATGLDPDELQFSPTTPLTLARVPSKQGQALHALRFTCDIRVQGATLLFSPIPGAHVPIRRAAAAGDRLWHLVQEQFFADPAEGLAARYAHWRLTLENMVYGDVAGFWNERVARPYLSAFPTIQAGRPVTLLPLLPASPEVGDAGAKWYAQFLLTNGVAPGKWAEPSLHDGNCLPGTFRATRPHFGSLGGPLPGDGAVVLEGVRTVEGNSVALGASFSRRDPLVVYAPATPGDNRASQPSVRTYDLSSDMPAAFANIPGFELPLELSRKGPLDADGTGVLTRIGSLDLLLRQEKDAVTPKYPRRMDIQVYFRPDERMPDERTGEAGPLPPATLLRIITVDVTAYLPAAAVRPGGEDDLPGEEFVSVNLPSGLVLGNVELERQIEQKFLREQPVVIPLTWRPGAVLSSAEGPGEVDIGGSVAYTIIARERTEAFRSQTLAMRLIAEQEQVRQAMQPILVLDRQPMMMALVLAPTLSARATAEGIAEIGVWSNVSPEWQLVGSTAGFQMLFPPQAVGEAAEKGKRSADPDKSIEDIEEDQTIDFRLSPPARFNLLASYSPQRFTEAPWNLRRILGYPGQTPEGAGVLDLQFELLYGLYCTVKHPYLRLAELSARFGRIQGRLPGAPRWSADEAQQKAYLEYRERWADRYARFLSRLAVLELWDSHQPRGLVLEEDVAYKLRSTARLKYPIPGKHPLPGNQDRPPDRRIPDDPDGLPGGVAWGFESQNIYEAVWRDPNSTSAKLARPFFSALGGWGAQKASFDRNLSTIQSETAMGRVFYYSVERIGRIGCFWNRCKHVIVYARTVAPTRQFVKPDEPAKDVQDRLLGRPVIRKVKEYVEILEPIRTYPEDSGSPAIARGCVAGCEFPKDNLIIPVDGRWGHDIPDGWIVPLWQPDADPEVYPKPNILLQLVADPQTAGANVDSNGVPVVKLGLTEPEKLSFYTYIGPAVPGTPHPEDATQTDYWPAVPNVDYPNYPAPQPAAAPSHAEGNLDTPMPDAVPIAPGFARFTYGLQPTDRLINLVAERVQKKPGEDDKSTINAVLRNVTMSRARALIGKNAPQVPSVYEHLDSIAAEADTLVNQVLSRLPKTGTITSDIVKDVQGYAKTLEQQAGALGDRWKAVSAAAQPYIDDPCAPLKTAAHDGLDRMAKRLVDLIHKFRDQLTEQVTGATNLSATTAIFLVDDVYGHIKSEFAPVSGMITGALSVWDARLTQAGQFLNEYDAQLQALIDFAVDLTTEPRRTQFLAELRRFQRLLDGILDRLQPVIGVDLKPARDEVARRVTEIEAAVTTAANTVRMRLMNLKQADPLNAARTALAASRSTIAGAVKEFHDALEVVGQWLETIHRETAAAVNALPTLSAAEVNRVIREKTEAVEKQLTRNSTPPSWVDRTHTAADAVLAAYCPLLKAEVQRLRDQLAQKLEQPAQKLLQQVQGLLGDGTKGVEQVQRELGALRGEVRDALGTVTNRVKERVGQEVKEVFQEGDKALRLLRAFGEAPRVEGLDFNRGQLGYYFNELNPRVALTPVTALVGRAADELDKLKPLGLRVPTKELLDRVIPDALPNLQLSDCFPDLAGLRLDNLFPGLKMPDLSNDTVKVTQGIDRQTLRAWLRARAEVGFTEPATLFAFGPVTVRVLRARFFAEALIEAGRGEPPRKKTNASISGDWEVQIGSLQLVTFRESSLVFDEQNHLSYNLAPSKIQMTGVIQFLSDVVRSAGNSDKGFSLKLVEVDGIPRGVQALLDLPLPSISAGAFGLSNLRLSASFELSAMPRGDSTDFVLAISLGIARKEAPFTLNVWILAGGGWFESRTVYAPLSGKISTYLSIGIAAGVKLAIGIGPIKGEVEMLFGVGAEFALESGRGNSLTITMSLLIRGEVEALGFISFLLYLLLEARYGEGKLVGRGTLKIRIKVCFFFTFEFEKSVEYQLIKNSGLPLGVASGPPEDTPVNPYEKSAREYIAMFEDLD